MQRRRRFRWILILAGLLLLIVAVQVIRPLFMEEERAVRVQLREAILEEFPDKTDSLKAQYRLAPFIPLGEVPEIESVKDAVVLVHGLDEPGKVWMVLAPELTAAGYAVWILNYPNDQPVADSARFMLDQLVSGPLSTATRIAVVAHSMGGLVTRELLTNPELAYAAKVEDGQVPQIDRFVMVGTPNQGSELARFRGFLELRDQASSLFEGDYHWLEAIVDGAGEAGVDLVPGSPFLEELNARPHPDGTRMLVIAGVSELAEQVGDGAVLVNSARLPEVPLVTVPGHHMTIIRNVNAGSQRMPTAVPVILEFLANPESESLLGE